jgi:phage terminase large subunit-like protein
MSLSLFQRLAEESPEQRERFLRNLPIEMQAELPRMPWWLMSRPEQQEPADDTWRFWLIMAGRGFGKTRTGAETIAKWARRYPGARIALVAITFGDGRDTMVEGEAGLLSVLRPSELRGGRQESAWNRSLGELFMANGTHFKIYSSEKPRQLRGPQFHFAWGDEPSYWADVAKGTAKDSAFSNLNFALRLPPRKDWDHAYRPRAIFTCTPRRVPLMKMPDDVVKEKPHMAGLTQRADVVQTRGSTMDNLHNLDSDYRAAVVDPMIGTTLGRQELGGELLEDVEGALWQQSLIDGARVVSLDGVDLHRQVVAMDPAGGSGIGHDEHGIIGMGYAGHRRDPHFYVTHDRSLNGTPSKAARAAILLYYEIGATALVYEKNQGGEWIPTVIDSTWSAMSDEVKPDGTPLLPPAPPPNLVAVTATKGKRTRAEPIAALSFQKRMHMVGVFAILEAQLTTWVPDETPDSPDRLDALVWAATYLYEQGPGIASVASPAARERRGRRPGMPSSRLPATFGARVAR